ncbi:MAG TPA: rhodanese-like domain-containing protein [Patescibacteria group bacterium]|nr:rhodanese-like domain-containing protein [Patescibacteria group bacterium]
MGFRFFATGLMVAVLSSGAFQALAMDAASVPEAKRTTLGLYLGSEEVPGFLSPLQGKALFLDVRTPAEVALVGMAQLADANVPILLGPSSTFDEVKGTFKLAPNPDFLAEAERRLAGKGLTKDDVVVVMCRSGDRSPIAANALAKAGFSHVWSVVDGFEGDLAKDGPDAGHRVVNGWKNKGLPWGYRLDKAKMYQAAE